MVTPSWSANCARVLSDKHSDYARSAVIAYWRLMPTVERHEALREALLLEPDVTQEVLAEEPIRTVTFGHSVFRMPPNRFLGVQDLVLKFDTEKRDGKGRRVGWALALMEMLVDPMLSRWVPSWVREQYERGNPYFRPCLRSALRRNKSRRNPDTNESEVVYLDDGVSPALNPEFLRAPRSNKNLLWTMRQRVIFRYHSQYRMKN